MGFNESEELASVIQQLVKQEFNKSDNYISLFIPAKIDKVNGNYCDAYLNGSNELTTNIPVNPSISVGENDEVWIIRTNFKNTDLFVLCKRVLDGYEHDYDKILQEVRTQIDETTYKINAVKDITNELTGKVDKNEAEFKITADEISSKVSKVQIEGLQTSNLLYNSEFNIGVQTVNDTVTPPIITYSDTLLEDWTLENPWLRSSSSIQFSTSGTISFGSAEQSFEQPITVTYDKLLNVTEGSKYVGSIYSLIPYEIEKNYPDGFWIELEWLTFEGNKIDTAITKASIVPSQMNEWQRFHVVGTAPSGVSYLRFKICSQTNGGMYIARPMLQKGEILTEWNPSREDTNHPLREKIILAESSITQTADQINLKVSKSTYDTDMQTIGSLISNGNLYVRGTGYNRTGNRILKLNDTTIYDTTGRGLRLTVLRRSDLSIVSDTNYDVYSDANARTSLTNALNILTDTSIVILSSYDAIVTDTALEDAIKRCGGTGKKFVSIPTPEVPIANHRTPYVLVGIPNVGTGGGLEVFTSDSATANYAELTTKIINGTPQGMDSIKGNTYSRLTVAESNITQQANLISLKVETTTFNSTISGINTKLADMSDDNKLAPSEKIEVKKEWDIIVMEKPILEAQATTYSITTEKTNYVNNYNTLNTYITPLLADLTTTSDIVGSTFRSNFVNYYKEKQNLENKIANIIKGIADTASANASTASGNASTALGQVTLMSDDNKLTPNEKQQLKIQFDGIVQEKPILETQATTFLITTEKTNYVNSYTTLYNYVNPLLTDLTTTSDITGTTLRTNFANYYKDKIALQNKLADVAKTTADSAVGTANSVQTTVNDFSDDNKLTPNEKQQIKIHWDGIYQEKPIIDAQATAYGVTTEKTNYGNAYTTLSNYITPLLTSLTTTSTIVGANLRTYFQDYFTQKATLLKKLDDTTKGIADTAKTDISNLKIELASDNKLSPLEKIDTKNELSFITNEKPTLETMATSYGITVEKTDYTTAYNNLNTYLTPLLADTTTTSDIVGTDFLLKFQDYYTKKLILTNKIADVTKGIADSANLSVTNLKLELADDNKLTSVEKQAVKREWDAIVQEKLLLEPQCTKYQVSSTNYVNAYTNLNNFLSVPLADLTTTSTIDGTLMRTNFVNYYKEKQVLLNVLDDASVGAIAVQDSIKKNPIFDNWSGTLPDNYTLYQTLNPTKETTLYRTGKNAVRFTVNSSATEAGLQSTDFQSNLANYKYIAVEIGFMLAGSVGSLSGAGLLFDWQGLTPYRSVVKLKDEVPTPEFNKWYTVKKVLKRPTDTISTFTGYKIFLMANYSGDGLGALTQKTIIFDKILAREATKEEIDVFETLPKKVDTSEVINAINSIDVTSTGIKIHGSQIDIQGAVTFSALDSTMQTNINTYNGWKQAGTTRINGGMIEADTIVIGSLEPTLETKVNNGDSAKSRLDDISNDNKLTPEEKLSLAKDWDAIFDEKPKIETQANLFTTITTEKTDFINAYNNLNTYLTPLLASPSTTDIITGIILRDNFSWYNTAKMVLLNKIAEVTKGIADSAKSSVTDIFDDNKFTPSEKQDVRLEWETISTEKPLLDTQATTYSITTEKTNLQTAFQTLANMLNNNVTWTTGVPSLISDANLNITSTITGTTFRTNFQSYYTARTNLINKITSSAQTTAETNAKNAVANGNVTLPASSLSGSFVMQNSNAIKDSASKFVWDTNGLTATDPNNANNKVKLSSAGLGVSTNGGVSYNNAITGSGISATYINAGILDCSRLTVTNLTVTEGMISGYISASKISGGSFSGVNIQTTYDSYYGHMSLAYGGIDFLNGSNSRVGYLQWDGNKMSFWGSGLQIVGSNISTNYSYSDSYNTAYMTIGSYNITSSSALYLGCGSSNAVVVHYQGNTSSYAEIRAWKFTPMSSRKLKTNIEDFNEDAISLVKSTKVRKYNYKSQIKEGNLKPDIGLIAEESPENIVSVGEVDEEGNRQNGIDLYAMTALLWKAVQEQQEMIEELQNKLL